VRLDRRVRAALLALLVVGCGSDNRGSARADARTDATGSDVDAATDASTDAAVAAFRIEEVGLDLNVSGANTEFVEISGEPGASLDNLAIRVIDSSGASGVKNTYALATAGTVMPADGRWVIGGALATVDKVYTVGSDDWDLDGTAGAIQLLRTTGPTLLDVVGYSATGTAVTPASSLTAPTQTAEGSAENISTGAASANGIGRAAGGADTDNNATDFCLQAKTAGAANGTCP
jgi:hypothetical protein